MCAPRNRRMSLLLRARNSLRFSPTSRMPTVICVGRRSEIATGLSKGSRTTGMTASVMFYAPRLTLDAGKVSDRPGGLANFVEQLEAVFAQGLILDVDGDLVEEGVDLGPQLG